MAATPESYTCKSTLLDIPHIEPAGISGTLSYMLKQMASQQQQLHMAAAGNPNTELCSLQLARMCTD
jgi:hypothetical protein